MRAFGIVLVSFLVFALAASYYLINFQTDWLVKKLQKSRVPQTPLSTTSLPTSSPQFGNELPDELRLNFDPTVDPVVFQFISINKTLSAFDLMGIFPPTWTNRYVTSRISCPFWDLRFSQTERSGPQYITLRNLTKLINLSLSEGKNILINGVCRDKNCTEIYKSCQINIMKR